MFEPNALQKDRFPYPSVLRTALLVVVVTLLSAISCSAQKGGASTSGVMLRDTVPHVRLTSPSIDFGNVILSRRDTLTIGIANEGADTLVITGIRHLGPDSTAFRYHGILPGNTFQFADTGIVFLSFFPTKGGIASDTVVFEHNGNRGDDTLLLTGYGVDVTATPLKVNFGNVGVGSCVTDTIWVLNQEGRSVVLTQKLMLFPSSQTRAFTILTDTNSPPVTVPVSQPYPILVRFCPTSIGADSIYWNGTVDDSLLLEVLLYGNGVENVPDSGSITLSTTDIDFGCVPVGQTSTRLARLTNSTSIPAPFLGFGSAFKAPFSRADSVSLQTLVPPDSSLNFLIQFAPKSPGEFSDSNTILIDKEVLTIRYRGTARATTLLVDSLEVDFGTISLCDNPVTRTVTMTNVTCGDSLLSVSFASGSGSDFRIVNSSNTTRTLFPDSSEQIVVGYNPREGELRDTIIVRFGTSDYFIPVRVSLERPQIELTDGLASGDTITFAKTTVGMIDSMTITLGNNGNSPGTIDSYRIAGPPNGFAIEPESPYAPTLKPRDVAHFLVTFAPSGGANQVAVVHIVIGCGDVPDTLVVWLKGTVAISDEKRTVAVASTEAEVGTRFTVDVRVAPPVTPLEEINGYHAALHVDPRSFYVHGVTDALASVNVSWTHDITGNLSITRAPQGPLVDGDLLFSVDLEGLSSGTSVNVITVDSITLFGLNPRVFDVGGFQAGRILLTGCDVDRGIAFSKATSVRSIRPNPVGNQATIEYVAAQGSHPYIEIFDLMGRPERRIELPSGTGDAQSIQIGIEGLPPGAYLLQLRMESERSTVMMIVDQ